MRKKCGNDAIFSKRKTNNEEEILMGGKESYEAVDRENYFN